MWFDIICLLILVLALIQGYRRGFMAQIGAFAGVVLGIICCQIFAADLAAKFSDPSDSLGTLLLNNVMAYFIIFIVCYLLGRIAGSVLVKTASVLHLGMINRVAGAVFTVFEYLLGLSILLNLWVSIFPDTQIRTRHDNMQRTVLDFAPKVFGSSTAQDVFGAVSNAADATKTQLQEVADDAD